METGLIVAIVAAAAVVLIAIGLATSSGGSGVNARLERYASGKPEAKAGSTGAGGIADMLDQSVALANLNRVVEQRDFGANLARDLARADLHLKISEYFMIWSGLHRRRARRDLPGSRSIFPALGNPFVLLIGGPDRVHAPALLAQSPQERPARTVQQAAAGHDHPDRQRPARRLVVPAGDRAGRARGAAADLDRVRPGHPRGQPRPGLRDGPREHGPARPLRRPGADGHGHLDPAQRRRQPGRDPRLDRLHDPRAGPDQGRDPHPDRPAAPVGLRRRLPADRPGRLPVHRRTRLHGPDVRRLRQHRRPAGRRHHPDRRRIS